MVHGRVWNGVAAGHAENHFWATDRCRRCAHLPPLRRNINRRDDIYHRYHGWPVMRDYYERMQPVLTEILGEERLVPAISACDVVLTSTAYSPTTRGNPRARMMLQMIAVLYEAYSTYDGCPQGGRPNDYHIYNDNPRPHRKFPEPAFLVARFAQHEARYTARVHD